MFKTNLKSKLMINPVHNKNKMKKYFLMIKKMKDKNKKKGHNSSVLLIIFLL